MLAMDKLEIEQKETLRAMERAKDQERDAQANFLLAQRAVERLLQAVQTAAAEQAGHRGGPQETPDRCPGDVQRCSRNDRATTPPPGSAPPAPQR